MKIILTISLLTTEFYLINSIYNRGFERGDFDLLLKSYRITPSIIFVTDMIYLFTDEIHMYAYLGIPSIRWWAHPVIDILTSLDATVPAVTVKG